MSDKVVSAQSQFRKTSERRNGEIDFFRFFFAVTIMLFHSGYAQGGWLGVDFFYLLSGFFMACSIERKRSMAIGDALDKHEYLSFLFRKINAFYVELILACGFALIPIIYIRGEYSVMFLSKLADFFANNVLLLRMTGITPKFDLYPFDVTWFLSSMLIALSILYPVFRRYGYNVLILLFALVAMGAVVSNGMEPTKCFAGTYNGNIRAFSEIAIGAFLYPLAVLMKNINYGARAVLALQLLKLLILSIIVVFCFKIIFSVGVALIAICILILLLFSLNRPCSQYFQNNVCLYLGRLSLPFYLCHTSCALIVKQFTHTGWPFLVLTFTSSFVVSALIMLLSQRIKEWMAARVHFQ